MNGDLPALQARGVSHRYGSVVALDGVDLVLPAGDITGFLGPDGVGKSTLLALLAGARRLQDGHITVLGGDMARHGHRRQICPRIAYNPQGLGRNLYATLSVQENLDYFGRLFGHGPRERATRIAELLGSTGLLPFAGRAVGKLSGGMKQKLGLCCALIHDPDLLILDEPTTGVDPLSRRHFWELIDRIRSRHAGMTVLVSTAYMEEAGRFDRLVAMHAGRILAVDTPSGMLQRTGCASLEDAFIALLPAASRAGHRHLVVPPRPGNARDIAIEAQDLSCRFGDFTAVDRVSFRIERGEIFGFLGSNGCGKTTTMKVLTGLLPPTEGSVRLFGETLDAGDMAVRRRVGYMSQGFSLYRDLTVRQNLELQGQLFGLDSQRIAERVDALLDRFGLRESAQALPMTLPLGHRQRLQLAAAVVHEPELLILDEPTSGVDPVARDNFWSLMIDLSRRDGVTIFVSTHFMNEAQRCDRVSLMHAGRVLASGSPTELAREHAGSLEDSFVAWLQAADAQDPVAKTESGAPVAQVELVRHEVATAKAVARTQRLFSRYRLLSCARRETLELLRDPIRLAMSLLGTVLLMVIIGYGISLDVKDLRYAVLDRDASAASRAYTLELAGSPYFVEQAPITSDADMDHRMRNGKLSLAVEIPPGFGTDLARGRPAAVGVWIDGAMPMRAEIISGYVQALHAGYVAQRLANAGIDARPPASVEVRYRYNPEVRSIVSMVPAVIPILLIFIPSMLAALAVVREKEMGSITNLYVTPVTKLEFLLGKQLPYVAAGMVNFALLTLMAVTVFGVPFSGSLATFTLAALLYVFAATGLGLLMSAFTHSQLAALFGTALATMLPAIQFSGIINPVSALQGLPALMGRIYPSAPFVTISRGTFSKALDFADLHAQFVPLALAGPVLLAVSVLLLRKQER